MRSHFLTLSNPSLILINLISTSVFIGCVNTPSQTSAHPTLDKRGVASQDSSSTEPVILTSTTKIKCLPNRGPSVAFEFYDPAVDLDFSSLLITSQDSLRDRLAENASSVSGAESTMKMELTPSGMRYFVTNRANLGFGADKISYSAPQSAPYKSPTTALIVFPAGLHVSLHSEKIKTSQGQFELAGSLATNDYEMNLVCRVVAPSIN
jgi:hypothetical protein